MKERIQRVSSPQTRILQANLSLSSENQQSEIITMCLAVTCYLKAINQPPQLEAVPPRSPLITLSSAQI